MEPQQQAIQAQGGNPQPLQSLFQNVVTKIRQGEQAFGQNEQAQDQEQLPQQQDNSAVSKALGILGDNSTAGQIGKANATPNYAYSGLCLKWVDDQTGNTQRQPTAFADYQANAQQGDIQTSTDNIPKGARVYFAPDNSNGGAGHIGLSNGDGTFTSATDSGIQTFDVTDWEKYSGQQFLGWAPANSA